MTRYGCMFVCACPCPAWPSVCGAIATRFALGQAGQGQAHTNMQPYLVMNYCIALQGIFPSRN